MEDQKRDMEGDQPITLPPKETAPPGSSREITIMIMEKVGKIRSFTISRRILLWLTVFLTLYILFSLFIISRFLETRIRFIDQSDRLKEIEEEYNSMEKDLLVARQRAANLEAYIESTKQNKEESGIAQDRTATIETHTESGKQNKETGGAVSDRQPSDVVAVDRPISVATVKVDEQATESVDIEGLDIRKLNSGVVLDFRLTNKASGSEAVEGYMHIIVSDQADNYPSVWNAPSREVKNGIPSEFRSGERFIIQRFKQYHREYTSESSFGMPARIKILAYGPSGNLILMKEYEVQNE